MPGTFTPWEEIGEGTDLLFYEGLHGGVVTPKNDVAKHVDLLIGMVPIVNLNGFKKLFEILKSEVIAVKLLRQVLFEVWKTIYLL